MYIYIYIHMDMNKDISDTRTLWTCKRGRSPSACARAKREKRNLKRTLSFWRKTWYVCLYLCMYVYVYSAACVSKVCPSLRRELRGTQHLLHVMHACEHIICVCMSKIICCAWICVSPLSTTCACMVMLFLLFVCRKYTEI